MRALEHNFSTTRVRQKTGAGVLPVDIIRTNDDYRIVMTQGKIEFGEYIDGNNTETLLTALGLVEQNLLRDYSLQIVSTGHSKVMIGIQCSDLLHRLEPDFYTLARLSQRIGCNGYYVFTTDSDDPEIVIRGRMFAPAIGVNEDPVTGNANGPLAAYLVHHRLVNHNGLRFHLRAKQGEAMGRAGIIDAEVAIANGEPTEVRIAGNAVVVFQTELTVG